MLGLIEEGKEQIQAGKEKEQIAADLALVTSGQKVKHYEISGYGTVRTLARQINAKEVANPAQQHPWRRGEYRLTLDNGLEAAHSTSQFGRLRCGAGAAEMKKSSSLSLDGNRSNPARQGHCTEVSDESPVFCLLETCPAVAAQLRQWADLLPR